MILGIYATAVHRQASTPIPFHVAVLDGTFGLESLVRYKS